MTKPSDTKVSRCVLCHQVYGPGADQQPKTAEQIAELERQNAALRSALQSVADWKFPATGLYWEDDITRPMSFGAAYGSNGERDYMRNLATAALASKEPE